MTAPAALKIPIVLLTVDPLSWPSSFYSSAPLESLFRSSWTLPHTPSKLLVRCLPTSGPVDPTQHHDKLTLLLSSNTLSFTPLLFSRTVDGSCHPSETGLSLAFGIWLWGLVSCEICSPYAILSAGFKCSLWNRADFLVSISLYIPFPLLNWPWHQSSPEGRQPPFITCLRSNFLPIKCSLRTEYSLHLLCYSSIS